MSQSMLALDGIAVLVATAMWLSLRLSTGLDLAVLPAYCRKRMQWWQANSRYVYLLCAAIGVLTLLLELRRLTA